MMLCSTRKNTAVLLVKSWNNSVYVYLVKIACYNTGDLSPAPPVKFENGHFYFFFSTTDVPLLTW